jgi:hypothetical protein
LVLFFRKEHSFRRARDVAPASPKRDAGYAGVRSFIEAEPKDFCFCAGSKIKELAG